ncbi:MAG: HAD family hydrolase [Planctomycetota bacterium]
MDGIDQGVRAVVLDLGGVVLRICRSWGQGCEATGVPLRPEPLRRMLEPGVEDVVAAYQSGRMDLDAFAAALSERSGGGYAAAEVRRVHEGWILGEYPGARDLVMRLRDRGVPTIALSNTCGAHWRLMPSFPAFAAIDHRIGSHLVGACKPDAAMYAAAERLLPPGDGVIAFFDDTPGNVTAATARGWSAHQVDPDGDPPGRIEAVLRGLGMR